MERSFSNQKVGSVPVFPFPNAEVSLGNTNPKCPLLIEKSAAHRDALYGYVCEWVNVKLYCKAL